jgi:hypothetical protein
MTEGQPNYTEHKSKEKNLKDFLMGIQVASMKFKNQEIAQKTQMLMAKDLENQQTEMKLGQMMQGIGQMQEQVSQNINNLPVLPINPMTQGLPPVGARPPLPQSNTAPAF